MFNSKSLWLELITLIAIAALIITVAARPANDPDNNPAAIIWVLGHVNTLQSDFNALDDKATHYLEHAPRDYDIYFRDAQITGYQLERDIERIDTVVNALARLADADTDPPPLPFAMNSSMPELGLTELAGHWNAFNNQLDEELGVDPEMPRLEWGARHIDAELGTVREQLATVERAAETRLQATTSTESAPAEWAGWALGGWLLLMLIWFGLRVQTRL